VIVRKRWEMREEKEFSGWEMEREKYGEERGIDESWKKKGRME